MKVDLKTDNVESFKIQVNSFGNKWCVIYLHGLFGSKDHKHVAHLINDLNAEKIDNCSFDFFAHGERKKFNKMSDLTLKKMVEEIKMVIFTLQNYGYKKFIFIGESFGGLIMQILSSIKVHCIGVVYLFSVFNFDSPGKIEYKKILKNIEKNEPFLLKSATGATEEYLSIDFLKDIKRFQETKEEYYMYKTDIPKLLLNGKYDTTVDYKQAINYGKQFDNAKCIVYDMEHSGYDKGTRKYCYDNSCIINKEIIKFIKMITLPYEYFDEKIEYK